ncbi:hypothetical protein [Halosolutus halophilus]|uniref:hypothetical protein n=1 Tax=Halosolutus halophilus TaxID=1552990 RepID=UPI0022352CBE|nr:hypothetical protein [Halosolutus halophilus]
MTEKDEVLPEEEAKYHPRLWMLDEFDGEINGEKKFHKSLVQYRDSVGLKEEWSFVRAPRGPTDPGFTEIIEKYDDLNLIAMEKEGQIHIYKETEKGSRFIRGLKEGLRILKKDQVQSRETNLQLVAKVNKERLGSDIELDDDIQEMKELPLGHDV